MKNTKRKTKKSKQAKGGIIIWINRGEPQEERK